MGLYENIQNETVEQLELRELVAVPRKAATRDVATLMRQKKLGCAIVVDSSGKPIGKFTERLLMRLLATDASLLDEPVEKNMLDDPHAVGINDSIESMLHLMESKRLRFVCIVDEKGKAIALSGQKGLIQYIAEHFPRQVMVQLAEDSKLYMSEREGA